MHVPTSAVPNPAWLGLGAGSSEFAPWRQQQEGCGGLGREFDCTASTPVLALTTAAYSFFLAQLCLFYSLLLFAFRSLHCRLYVPYR